MKRILIFVSLLWGLFSVQSLAESLVYDYNGLKRSYFYYEPDTPHEGVCGTFSLDDKYPEVCITVDAPEELDSSKQTEIIFYALPNGNSIVWTAGKRMTEGDDWHYDIQHIAAQTKFLRAKCPDRNIVTVYLADRMRSWTTWRRRHADILPETLPAIIGDIAGMYAEYDPHITLSSHSGGGYFLFEYIRTAEKIDPGSPDSPFWTALTVTPERTIARNSPNGSVTGSIISA